MRRQQRATVGGEGATHAFGSQAYGRKMFVRVQDVRCRLRHGKRRDCLFCEVEVGNMLRTGRTGDQSAATLGGCGFLVCRETPKLGAPAGKHDDARAAAHETPT